jgi:hypothetical protein
MISMFYMIRILFTKLHLLITWSLVNGKYEISEILISFEISCDKKAHEIENLMKISVEITVRSHEILIFEL